MNDRRSNTTVKKEKPAARKAHAIASAQETQARKKQKLDGGKLKQVQILSRLCSLLWSLVLLELYNFSTRMAYCILTLKRHLTQADPSS